MSEPRVPDEVRNLPDDFMDTLRYTDEPVPDLPPPGDWERELVPRSVKWPAGLDKRLKDAALARGLSMSELMRQFAEAGLALMGEQDELLSKADLIRLISSLHGRKSDTA